MNIEQSIDYLNKFIFRQKERMNKFRKLMGETIKDADAKTLIRWAEDMHEQELLLKDSEAQLIVYKKMKIRQK
jgi:hypothetical protein